MQPAEPPPASTPAGGSQPPAPAAAAAGAPPEPRPPVVVRACASFQDCAAVAALCGQEFKEECYGQGLSVQKWVEIEAEELQNRPSWWRQIGLAVEGERLLGVVVLTLENEEDDSISWSEYSRRVGCGPTILSMMYDRVLDEQLLEHECLIDFIAVSPEARGKGVGARLMAWAEATGAAVLAETEASAVAAHGVDMTLWVAADNAAAIRLYQRAGYAAVRRTDGGACHCMASRVLKWFLGHPVWIKMHKQLPPPEHLAAHKPEQLSIPVAALSGAAAGDGQLEEVPLEAPAPRQQQPDKAAVGCAGWLAAGRQPRPAAAEAPAAPDSPGRRLLRKVSHGLFAAGGEATPLGQGGAPTPTASQGPTPRIAAVGSAAAGAFGSTVQAAPLQQAGGYARSSTYKEGGGYLQLSVHAVPSAEHSAAAGESGGEPGPWAPAYPASAASASVASIASSAPSAGGDSDSDSDDSGRAAYRAAGAGALGAQPQAFELVQLSDNSATAQPSATTSAVALRA